MEWEYSFSYNTIMLSTPEHYSEFDTSDSFLPSTMFLEKFLFLLNGNDSLLSEILESGKHSTTKCIT
jgi:hypothetical protein